MESIIIGGLIPLAGNLIKSIFASKDKKVELAKTVSDNDVKLAQINADIIKSNNDFEAERQKTIASTWDSGNKIVDACNNGVRVLLGLISGAVLLICVIAYFRGGSSLIDADGIEGIIKMIIAYYISERTCTKVF
jgi:hypothetical protein